MAEDEKTIASPATDPRRGEHLLLWRRIGAWTKELYKTPIPNVVFIGHFLFGMV